MVRGTEARRNGYRCAMSDFWSVVWTVVLVSAAVSVVTTVVVHTAIEWWYDRH